MLDATLCFVDDATENDESFQTDAKMSDEKRAQEETAEDGEQVGEEQDGDATKADLWDSGVLGGYDCYVEGGDVAPEDGYDTMAKGGDGEDDDEEEGGPLIKCTAKSNSLCLALRDGDVLRCVFVCVCMYVRMYVCCIVLCCGMYVCICVCEVRMTMMRRREVR